MTGFQKRLLPETVHTSSFLLLKVLFWNSERLDKQEIPLALHIGINVLKLKSAQFDAAVHGGQSASNFSLFK